MFAIFGESKYLQIYIQYDGSINFSLRRFEVKLHKMGKQSQDYDQLNQDIWAIC